MKIITEEDITTVDGVITKVLDMSIGDTVVKTSGKPFKHAEKTDVIAGFSVNTQFPVNPTRPLNAMGAFLSDSQTNVCVTMLQKVS